jgi:hypothetical protein
MKPYGSLAPTMPIAPGAWTRIQVGVAADAHWRLVSGLPVRARALRTKTWQYSANGKRGGGLWEFLMAKPVRAPGVDTDAITIATGVIIQVLHKPF